MSDNLDVVRSIYAAWERGDWSSVEWADPEIGFVFADGPLPGSWTGRTAMSEAWRDFLGNWEDWRIVVEEYRELDEERVLVLVRNSGRGKRNRVKVEQIAAKAANLLHIREGRVVRLVAYADRNLAFAELGLAPKADSDSRD